MARRTGLLFFCITRSLIFTSFTTGAPIAPASSLYEGFLNDIKDNDCSLPDNVDLSSQNPGEVFRVCNTSASLEKDGRVNIACREALASWRDLLCSKVNVTSPVSVPLSDQVCADLKVSVTPDEKKDSSFLALVSEETACSFVCFDEMKSLCKALLWSRQVLAAIQNLKPSMEAAAEVVQSADSVKTVGVNTPDQTLNEQNSDKSSALNNVANVEHSISVAESVQTDEKPVAPQAENNLGPNSNTLPAQTSSNISDHLDGKETETKNEVADDAKQSQPLAPESKVSNLDTKPPSAESVNLGGKDPPAKQSHLSENNLDGDDLTDLSREEPPENPNADFDSRELAVDDESAPDRLANNSDGGHTIGTIAETSSGKGTAKSSQETQDEASKGAGVDADATLAVNSTKSGEKSQVDAKNTAAKTDLEAATKNLQDVSPAAVTKGSEVGNPTSSNAFNTDSRSSQAADESSKISTVGVSEVTVAVTANLEQMESGNPQDGTRDFNDEDFGDADDTGFPPSDYDPTETRPVDKVETHRVNKPSKILTVAVPQPFDIPSPSAGDFQSAEDSNFFYYMTTFMLVLLLIYVIVHNKQKIIALIVEGRHERTRRRSHGASYRKLDNK